MVEHVIGNDGVVSPILTSGTSFLLSPYFKGFFYALFSAHFNLHVGVTRHSRRQTRPNNIVQLLSRIFQDSDKKDYFRRKHFIFLLIHDILNHVLTTVVLF